MLFSLYFRFPFVCISVGCYINKKPRIGVIYNPILNDLYTARAGQGAFKNGFPIHCSSTQGIPCDFSRADIIGVAFVFAQNFVSVSRHDVDIVVRAVCVFCVLSIEIRKSIAMISLGLHNLKFAANALDSALANNRALALAGIHGCVSFTCRAKEEYRVFDRGIVAR